MYLPKNVVKKKNKHSQATQTHSAASPQCPALLGPVCLWVGSGCWELRVSRSAPDRWQHLRFSSSKSFKLWAKRGIRPRGGESFPCTCRLRLTQICCQTLCLILLQPGDTEGAMSDPSPPFLFLYFLPAMTIKALWSLNLWFWNINVCDCLCSGIDSITLSNGNNMDGV